MPYWGWGTLPDQYGRSGTAMTETHGLPRTRRELVDEDLAALDLLADLPAVGSWQWLRRRPPS